MHPRSLESFQTVSALACMSLTLSSFRHPSLRPQEISRRRRPWQLPLSLRKRYIISLLCCERRGLHHKLFSPLGNTGQLPMVRGDILCLKQRGSSDKDTIYSATGPNGMDTHAHSTGIIIPRGYCRARTAASRCVSLFLLLSPNGITLTSTVFLNSPCFLPPSR